MIELAGAAPEDVGYGLLPACVAALATALFTWLFARIAERSGWVDDGSDAPYRKLQARPVAPIGGAAILCGCGIGAIACTWIGDVDWLGWVHLPGEAFLAPAHLHSRRAWITMAILAAFAVGVCDDLKPSGLSPLQKLAGQMVAGLLLAIAAGSRGGESDWTAMVLWFLAAVIAQNALNTFDNADGAAAVLALLGFSTVAPVIAGALCGFLPFNLWIRRTVSRDEVPASVPCAYLGDSGSHALGILMLLHPLTMVALLVPALDLARVSVVRMKLGIAPWIGDRRHLAHRMMERGWSPTITVAGLCLIAAPAFVAFVLERNFGGGWLLLSGGVSLSIVLFSATLALCSSRA